jgi:hypothetical protein
VDDDLPALKRFKKRLTEPRIAGKLGGDSSEAIQLGHENCQILPL